MLRSLAIASALVLAGCQQHAADQQQRATLALTSDTLAQRQYTTRRFETKDEVSIMAASAGVLQDLGFNIDETSRATGLLVASKNRDAVEAGQVTGQIFLAALVAAMGGRADPVWERDQKIRISVVTKPAREAMVVRVTIQRLIWNTKNQISRVESIDDPVIYQQFFDKLAQSVFLEAHEI
ncbi:MAG: hypothetical protein KG075_00360 [Alphaproteobacteria bacterium]|jgi:hypothetical protein|nr:hypothetical protein [Alphaproteobacteria bacterium]